MTIRWSTGRIVQVMVRGVCGEGSAGGEGDVPKYYLGILLKCRF